MMDCQSPVDIDDRLAAEKKINFLAEYVMHRRDVYAVQKDDGGYRKVDRSLNVCDLQAHLSGSKTLGAYQARYPEETCRWIVYDVDNNGDGLAEVQRGLITDALTQNGIPYYVEASGTPGSLHIWVFLERPAKLDIAYNFSRAMILYKDHYLFSDEIFPKQERLSEAKPYGNLVKVPFGINRKNGGRSVFEGSILNENVETINLSRWQKVQLPKTKPGFSAPVLMDSGQRGVGLIAGGRAVRPCIQHVIDSEIQMKYYAGHRLRVAVASELLVAGYSRQETADVFRCQMDYDPEKSLYQVESVRGYNRPSCDTIRWHCKALQSETGFNIDTVCQTCILRDDGNHENKHWGSYKKASF